MAEKKGEAMPSTYSPSSTFQSDVINNNKDLHPVIFPSNTAYNNSNG